MAALEVVLGGRLMLRLLVLWVTAPQLVVEGPSAVLHHTLYHRPHTPHGRPSLGPPCCCPQQGTPTEDTTQRALNFGLTGDTAARGLVLAPWSLRDGTITMPIKSRM